ncbi:MAG: hypothetical protein M1827_004416 [Pycnora praestabilis]|nr:MAG: hypothetical protein M1827_004416 [Pycnora praestabilis]
MAPQFPSIQTFFHPETSNSPTRPRRPLSPSSSAGNGFTAAEVENVLHPTVRQWTPHLKYEGCDIATLVSGPRNVTFTGRVLNFFDQQTESKMPKAAKGFIKVVLGDGSGALVVRLWYANMDYCLRLGHLVSVWTIYVSAGETSNLTYATAPLVTTIFPERDSSCHFMVHGDRDDDALCKTPLGYAEGQPLPGLMTVRNFIDGGCDIDDAKILVCVKSKGPKKKFTSKKGRASELIKIGIFDDTAEATFTLWGSVAESAAPWRPSDTVLLITSPGWSIDRKAHLSINGNTYVEVDPCMTDVHWLRAFAQRVTKRDHVNQPFPVDFFNVKEATSSELRIRYTVADIDEFVRAAPKEIFIGYLSVTIIEINLVLLYYRNMLLCTECCGLPLFANATTATCRQCDKQIDLALNPKIVLTTQIGSLIDETGSIIPGKLVWSTEAWVQLFGRTADYLASTNAQLLSYMEKRLLFLRFTLVFGWSEDIGKLAICRVMR